MDTMSYIGGLMDADGSFNISVSLNRYKNKKGESEPQFAFIVNFRQLEKARDVLEEFQTVLGGGKIYDHAHAGSQKMLTWQTTKVSETLEVAEKLLPYLRIKKHECELLIEACKLYLETPREPGNGGGGRPRVPKWVKTRVANISSQMNVGQQKESSRRNQEIRKILVDPMEGFFNASYFANVEVVTETEGRESIQDFLAPKVLDASIFGPNSETYEIPYPDDWPKDMVWETREYKANEV